MFGDGRGFGQRRPQEPEGRRLKILERKALETLDLPEAATGAEIKSRYKTLVKRSASRRQWRRPVERREIARDHPGL